MSERRAGERVLGTVGERPESPFGGLPVAELLALLWLLPLPDCQSFLDGLTQLVRRTPLNVAATFLAVDFHPPWQTVS